MPDVLRRLDELVAIAEHRLSKCTVLEVCRFDMLTQEERQELHELKMLLPSSAEEREAGRARIQERLLSRRRGKRGL